MCVHHKVKFTLWKGGDLSQKKKATHVKEKFIPTKRKATCTWAPQSAPTSTAPHTTWYKLKQHLLGLSSAGIPSSKDHQAFHRRTGGTSAWSRFAGCLTRALSYISQANCSVLSLGGGRKKHRTCVHPDGQYGNAGLFSLSLFVNFDKREHWLRWEEIWTPPNIYGNFTFHHLGPQLFAKGGNYAKSPVSSF